MYNELLKQEFIDQFKGNESKQQGCLWLFGATEPYEKIWSADICTKDGADLQKVVDRIDGFRSSSKGRRAILREYFKWCVEKGVPGAKNGIVSTNFASTDKMRTRTVSSPLHLQKYLDALFQEEKLLTRDNVVRAYCWLAYSGMAENEIVTVRCDEVDLENRIISHNGKEYPVYAESMPCLRNCKELSYFVYRHPLYPDKTSYRERVPGDLLLRVTVPDISCAVFRHDLSVAIRKMAEKNGGSSETEEERLYGRADTRRLSYYRIWISGLFYRAYLAESFKIDPDFSEAVLDFSVPDEKERTGEGDSESAVKRKLEKNYLADYKLWKKTYYN